MGSLEFAYRPELRNLLCMISATEHHTMLTVLEVGDNWYLYITVYCVVFLCSQARPVRCRPCGWPGLLDPATHCCVRNSLLPVVDKLV